MGRTVKDNRDLPHPRPVKKIELSADNTRRRIIAAVLFLLIGAVALAYAFFNLITPEAGWQAIEVSSSAGVTCADEFVFLYELGSSGAAVQAENRAVSMLYTQAAQKAYQLFNSDERFDGVTNVYDMNRQPNQVLKVDETLYRAFNTIKTYGDRTIFLGPVYARYNDLFFCEDDAQLMDFDPRLSESVRQEYSELAAFAVDPTAIDLQLLGENQVRLYVSENYLAYAEQVGIVDFIDFSWMKNAFIVDYLAQVMTEHGYTHGSISSYDGFLCNLDDRDTLYSLNLFDRVGGVIYQAASMEYVGAMSVVYLRDYPINDMDELHYYELRNGEIRTPYLDVQDGLCKSAVGDLTAYSRTLGCAEILLQISPIYIADEFQKQALDSLSEREIYSIYCENQVIFGNDPELSLTRLYETDELHYSAVQK